MASLEKTMFREYDLRGRESEEELNESSMYHIARGFGALLRKRDIIEAVVANDARATSERFNRSAARGLLESGISIINIGTVTTPMSYWAQYHLSTKGLLMVTASHNPAGWNGVKLGIDLSKTLLPQEMQELYEIITAESYVSGEGTERHENITEAYYADVLSRVSLKRPLKVLINTGNGTAGLFAPELFRRMGVEVVEHLTALDPTYPTYTPNPDGTHMMTDTGEQVRAHGCDLGMAFDGDGDRLGLTDENGATVWPDRYIALLARLILKKKPGAKIIFDVKVSEALPEDIAAHGGVPIMWKTGHSYIKAKLQEEQAALAGEMSGHIFFADGYYGFDDAFFAGLKMLEYISHEDTPVSALVRSTPYYLSTPTIQVNTTDEKKYQIAETLTKEFQKEGYRVVTLSGARVYIADGWGLVRASSNTPTLVMRFEAKTKEGLERIEDIFREKLSKIPEIRGAWNTSGH
jgi:phosphomannomutase / phosphoglucomutase